MLGILFHILMFTGGLIALAALGLLLLLLVLLVSDNTNQLFKDIHSTRYNRKFFNKIEEFRNDFA